MKKLLLCGALATGCCLTSVAQSKINNAGYLQIDQFNNLRQEMAKTAPQRAAALNKNVTVYVTLVDGATAADLEAYGVTVLDTTANMAIVSLPITEVEALADEAFVDYIDFGYQAAPFMDQARQLSFMAGVHEGTAEGLTKAYRGQGVYVGLYDVGLDPNHVNFTDHDGNTRVKAVYLSNNGKVSAYDTPESVSVFTTDSRTDSHGTHVLGTITGRDDIKGNYAYLDGTSTKLAEGSIPYYGVAPDADIIVGCGSFDDASINAGIGAVIDRAKKDGKPVIVNLSLGHNRGSHDPNETVNRYLDSRAADAIIVVAAGNEGGSQMSVEREFARNSTLRTSVVPTDNAKATIFYSAEFWNNDDTPFEAELVLFDKVSRKALSTKKITGKSGSITWTTNSDDVMAENFESGSTISARWGVDNSTDRFNVSLSNNTTAKNSDVVFGISISGKKGMRVNGYCDAYTGYSQSEVRFASVTGWSGSVTGTDVGSINGMACGLKTISVGAYVSRTNIPNLAGGRPSYNAGEGVGSIANFSSYGKSGDGRQLPIVCAPGAQIISSVSRYWVQSDNGPKESVWSAKADYKNETHPWYYMQGTSMACPFVSGTIALWLEACPGLRATEAQKIIASTSTKDAFTTDADRWGAGKINVLAGLKEAIKLSASIESTLADNADQNLMILAKDGKQFEVSCAGVNNLACTLYNMQGAAVALANSDADTVNLDASSLVNGIYVLSVNAAGQKLSRKLVIK